MCDPGQKAIIDKVQEIYIEDYEYLIEKYIEHEDTLIMFEIDETNIKLDIFATLQQIHYTFDKLFNSSKRKIVKDLALIYAQCLIDEAGIALPNDCRYNPTIYTKSGDDLIEFVFQNEYKLFTGNFADIRKKDKVYIHPIAFIPANQNTNVLVGFPMHPYYMNVEMNEINTIFFDNAYLELSKIFGPLHTYIETGLTIA